MSRFTTEQIKAAHRESFERVAAEIIALLQAGGFQPRSWARHGRWNYVAEARAQ